MAMDDVIATRLRLLLAAIDENFGEDISSCDPTWKADGSQLKEFVQDWTGGETVEAMHNRVHVIVSKISSLEDYLRKWARARGQDPKEVSDFLKQSAAFCVIRDLDNLEKHGGSGRDGWSGRDPRIENLDKRLRVTPGTGTTITISRAAPKVEGDGKVETFVTGIVVDRDGKRIGELHEIFDDAFSHIEALLAKLGVMTQVTLRRPPAPEMGKVMIVPGLGPPPEGATPEQMQQWIAELNRVLGRSTDK